MLDNYFKFLSDDMKGKYQAINWNNIQDRVDYSVWARLGDLVWEPERIPVKEDLDQFRQLSKAKQDAVLNAFAALSFLSTLQVKVGNDAVKQDSATDEEFSVFNAFAYHESVANKAYSDVIAALSEPVKTDAYFEVANNNQNLQKIAELYLDIYRHGNAWQKKIALSFMEMSLYHACFYAPLYLFGNKQLVRTAEVVKLAIRTTSFNAMYPGVKFRLAVADYPEIIREKIKVWTKNFQNRLEPLMHRLILDLYEQVGWQDDALYYWHYTMNKNYLNLGYAPQYDEDVDQMSDQIQNGIIKNADFEDFFYYSNTHTLTRCRIK